MSKITNLIGTTWRLDGATISGLPQEYGNFNVTANGAFTLQYVSVEDGSVIESQTMDVDSYEIACGYLGNLLEGFASIIPAEDGVSVYLYVEGNYYYYPLNWFANVDGSNCICIYEFTITGGQDISNPLFIDFINTYGTLVSGGEPPTAEGVKSKLQSLITASNAKTGKSDANLTDAVKTLLEGYGQGGDSPLPIEISTEDEMTALLETAEVGSVYKYTGETGTFDNEALYVVGAGASGNKSLRELIEGSSIIGTLPAIGTSLEDCTWEEISAISAAGKGAEYFNIGDTKSVYIKGTVGTLKVDTTLEVYIIGFDHNTDITGDTGITFGTFKTADGVDVALCDSNYRNDSTAGTKYFNMNHWSNYNYGGWAASDLRYDILGSTDAAPSGYGSAKTTSSVGYDASATCATNPVADTLMAALPLDLRKVMKPMTIYTDSKGNKSNAGANVTASVDYLPLLAEYEVFGTIDQANQYEQNQQAQYAYYAAGNSSVKYKHLDTTTSVLWWERSACRKYDNIFCNVHLDGSASRNYTNGSLGIAPVFLV